jgi:hypothetical protein
MFCRAAIQEQCLNRSSRRRILAGMNWRRGVVLAAIHLVVAALVIVRTEANYWPAIRSERVRVPVVVPPTATAEEMMEANFYPCDEGGIIDRPASPGEIVIGAANMPAVLLVGWHAPCAQPSALDTVVEKKYGRTRRAEVLILTIQCAALVVWWLLVGGCPLVRPRRWWLEPGAFITACTLPVALVSLLIPVAWDLRFPIVDGAAMVPAVVAILAWLWWCGLLIWKTSRFATRLLVGSRQRAAR